MVLGIIGLATGLAIILCPIAWAFSSQDMQKIEAGEMSRKGEGMLKAGYIMGIVGTILGIVLCGGGLLLWIIAAATVSAVRY